MSDEPSGINRSNLEVTPRMMAVIWRMLAKKPVDRYQTSTELLKDLESLRSEAGKKS
jgi:hypothetical protein